MAKATCSVIRCRGAARSRGLCNRHYLIAWNDGTLDLVAPLAPKIPTSKRFWDKVDKAALDGHWLWTASRDPLGYGRFGSKHLKDTLAHRIAYEYMVGPIPAGMTIDHLCRVPSCVNPEHLEVVTAIENTRRMFAARVPASACRRGHEFTPDNTIIQSSGARQCRTCHARAVRRHGQRRRSTS